MAIERSAQILLYVVIGLFLACAIAFVAVLVYPAPLERWLEDRILLALRQHYRAEVTLQNLRVVVSPVIHATADNLVVPNRGDPRLPPLITVKHVSLEANLLELLRTPIRISQVQLLGMEIRVVPKRENKEAPGGNTLRAGKSNEINGTTRLANFVIEKVSADGAELYILRKDPSREPLLFDLRKLQLRSAGIDQPMNFTAELTNPTPPGLIETTGHFGPWNFDEPGATSLGGHYTFEHADLSVFNGISGTLSSVGNYSGVLHNIIVDGTTDVPNFQLDRGGEQVHLTTSFHAIVDGTNGNTYLQPVKAHFLNSDLETNGEVAGKPGEKGKTVTLDVDMEHARVQDVLVLATKSEPAVTGSLALKAKLNLPPGKEVVLHRMQLDGKFHVTNGHFTSENIKKVIAQLSRRGQGKPDDTSITDVPAEFAGDFRLSNSTLTFSGLEFMVPGAIAQFKGTYGLSGQTLNFTGDVRLHATLSQMVTRGTSWLLVPFDPLFEKHGAGVYLPMTIDGTREHPQVHVQWGKLFGS
jgi:hypothetical protein